MELILSVEIDKKLVKPSAEKLIRKSARRIPKIHAFFLFLFQSTQSCKLDLLEIKYNMIINNSINIATQTARVVE
jgi:hypothetical protein